MKGGEIGAEWKQRFYLPGHPECQRLETGWTLNFPLKTDKRKQMCMMTEGWPENQLTGQREIGIKKVSGTTRIQWLGIREIWQGPFHFEAETEIINWNWQWTVHLFTTCKKAASAFKCSQIVLLELNWIVMQDLNQQEQKRIVYVKDVTSLRQRTGGNESRLGLKNKTMLEHTAETKENGQLACAFPRLQQVSYSSIKKGNRNQDCRYTKK